MAATVDPYKSAIGSKLILDVVVAKSHPCHILLVQTVCLVNELFFW